MLCCRRLGNARHSHCGGATVGGALGGDVAETVVHNQPVKIKILDLPEFAPTG
jgi:hypothetical protein